jgi:hypothetical protein
MDEITSILSEFVPAIKCIVEEGSKETRAAMGGERFEQVVEVMASYLGRRQRRAGEIRRARPGDGPHGQD